MPNRASELVWDEPDTTATGGLSRSAVVRAAMELADTEGLDAVSIRRVAAKLGVRPMSLYTHIASKDDLLDLMLNETIGEALVPEPLPEDWREALRQIARYSYDAFVAHSWVLRAFARREQLGPNVLRHGEQSAAAVAGLELEIPDIWTVLGTVDDYVIGHALRTLSARKEGDPRQLLPEFDPAEFPNLARATEDFDLAPPDEAFEIGLELVLDGIEKRFLSR
jgi:AcrR family transcriptional regulator